MISEPSHTTRAQVTEKHSGVRDLTIVLYTDGSYHANLKRGGWAVVAQESDGTLRSFSGVQATASSLEMELVAAVQGLDYALSRLQRHLIDRIILYTDSKILLEGLEHKIHHYRKHGWLLKSGRKVPFRSLWERLESQASHPAVSVKWVKAHHRSRGNRMADRLARQTLQPIAG